MSRSQDTVIDDDEETCPLCIEEFDLSDKNFRPCPCGYQICQFCFNSLKTTYEKSTCPNCRRPYDEKTIQYKIPTAEEFKLDQLNKNKKQAAAKRKETEKREVENSSRRNLAGVRVKQQNLVYVIGLIPQIKDEQALLQTLRGPEYFGQYGEIEKIVVSKAKPGAANQGIGVYVTYARKEDAALCINTVDGSLNGDRVLRAQFGTTKYCSAYLRGETCTNKNCSFLHETGEDGQHSSLQNEPHGAKLPTRPVVSAQPSQMNPPPRPQSAAQNANTQPMARQGSKENDDSRKNSHDGSALPSTASWAAANASVARTRRASQSNSRATPSPQTTHASLAAQKPDEHKAKEPLVSQPSTSAAPPKTTFQPEQIVSKPKPKPMDPIQKQYEEVLRCVSRSYRFIYDDSCLSPEARAAVDDMPCFIDPYGGAKRRAMREKEEAERAKLEAETKAKLEAQATSAAEETLDEDNIVAGSLALGGEPEDDPRGSSARGAIGRPAQSLSDQFSTMGLNNRSLTPQQRQQLALLNTGNLPQAPGLNQPSSQNIAFEMSDFERRGPQYSQAQYEQISSHQRHGSRYFNNDTKAATTSRFQGQQQSFYSSGVQGPPPGLPTAGTPPVSGGGMFAHGQNFTNPGFGTSKDINAEVYSRNRSGTNQGHDLSKLDEKNFPPLPARPDSQPPHLHSRVSSFQSHYSSGLRSSTPKVPPGFELSHGHPAPIRSVSPTQPGQAVGQRSTSISSVPIAPAVPIVPLTNRTSTPKPKGSDPPKEDSKVMPVDDAPISSKKPSTGVNEISLGSPKPKSSRQKSEIEKKLDVAEKVEEKIRKKDDSRTLGKVEDTKGKGKAPAAKPGKIDLPQGIASDAPTNSPLPSVNASGLDKSATPILDSAVVGTPATMSPRPVTPVTTTPSETSKTSMPRPRTLRVTTGMVTKTLEQTPASATTEKSSAVPPISAMKKGSRRPSLSSAQLSRPSTPAMSERPSHDASRASSPPPSIVGSAPERNKSKAQLKKERREKSKKTTDTNDNVPSAATTPVVEEVAPVIARQKKQKKQRLESGTPASGDEKAKPKSQEIGTKTQEAIERQNMATIGNAAGQKKTEEKDKASLLASQQAEKSASQSQKPGTPRTATPKQESAARVDEAKGTYTMRDLYNEAEKMAAANDGLSTHAAMQKLLNEHISSMPKIFSSLIQMGDLSREHPWLNPPSFNSATYKLPPDSRRGQEYLDGNGYSANDAFGYIYLPLKEKQALKDGNAVSVADAGERKDDLLKRCLVTPNGWVLRHLSADEGEKLLELEERRQIYLEEFGDLGTMAGLGVLETDDYTNLGGGMERLARHGERHGVVWIMGEDGEMVDDDEFEPFDDEDGEIDGEIGDSDEEAEEEEYGEGDSLDVEGGESFEADDSVNMPGGWDLPPRDPHHAPRVGSGGRINSLPGLGPHSRTNALRLPSRGPPIGQEDPVQQDNRATAGPSTAPQNASKQSPAASATNAANATTAENVNVRLLDADALQKRVQESQKALDAARKEMEKAEKLWNKKAKDIGRWREGLIGSLGVKG
ncbi:RING/Ubox like zinc-binding domain-containing protein [Cladophialophora immunda]|nr:RING/Ubox like zinc-binding domain-containing protein [Cladophialophora immunda]